MLIILLFINDLCFLDALYNLYEPLNDILEQIFFLSYILLESDVLLHSSLIRKTDFVPQVIDILIEIAYHAAQLFFLIALALNTEKFEFWVSRYIVMIELLLSLEGRVLLALGGWRKRCGNIGNGIFILLYLIGLIDVLILSLF